LIAPGTTAPDFSLSNQNRETVTLSGFRGRKNVVVAFHPLAFTPLCSAQVQSYERERPSFEAHDAHVLAISSDPGPSKKAWADALGGVSSDLLSDFHPQGQVAAAYGVLRDDGLAERSVFLIDKAGVIRWAREYGMETAPDVRDVIQALERLR
jgi:peroxiredoxin (alkyl hydroperoxide reductase subunit C)